MTDLSGSAQIASGQRLPTLSGQLLLFAAFILFGIVIGRATSVAGLIVLLATALLVTGAITRAGNTEAGDPSTMERQLFVGIALFGILGLLGWSPSVIGPSHQVLERAPGAVWITLGLLIFGTRKRRDSRVDRILIGLVLLASFAFGVLHLSAARGVGLDVLFLHKEAADAMASGLNPYSDAVEVPNGAPTADPGDLITGYVYPAVTAVAYALGEWLIGDPRYTSLAAWLCVLIVMGVAGLKRRSTVGLLAMTLLASLPGWPYVLRAAWTEPLSLAFLTIALITWGRPVTSGACLGMALASKQYFFVTAPLLLARRTERWPIRSTVAIASIIATVGPAFIVGAEAFWSAAIEFHLSTPVRADSANLVGLVAALGFSWGPPPALSGVLGLTAALLLSRRVRSGVAFLLAISGVLAFTFLVASQAFANYWFLVAGLLALSLAELAADQTNLRQLPD